GGHKAIAVVTGLAEARVDFWSGREMPGDELSKRDQVDGLGTADVIGLACTAVHERAEHPEGKVAAIHDAAHRCAVTHDAEGPAVQPVADEGGDRPRKL